MPQAEASNKVFQSSKSNRHLIQSDLKAMAGWFHLNLNFLDLKFGQDIELVIVNTLCALWVPIRSGIISKLVHHVFDSIPLRIVPQGIYGTETPWTSSSIYRRRATGSKLSSSRCLHTISLLRLQS